MAGDLNKRSQLGKQASSFEHLLINLNVKDFRSRQTLIVKKMPFMVIWNRFDIFRSRSHFLETHFINEVYFRMCSGNSVEEGLFT